MESTLSLTLALLESDVGQFLGYGRGANESDTAWSTQQQKDITTVLKSGLRQFYVPEPLEGEQTSYDWSFMKPIATLPFLSGAQSLALPDDFGEPEGQISVVGTATALQPWAVPFMGEGALRQAYALTPTQTGRPIMAAVVPLKATGTMSGQRFQLNLFPIADQNYTLQFPYYLNPDFLTTAFPYPLGGMQHAETIREAVLMAAENFLDDAAGLHTQKFQVRLAASVNADRKLKPQRLGYNRDNSDAVHVGLERSGLHGWGWGGIKVGGVQY